MSKIMKRIFIGLSAIVAIAMGLSGCDSDRTTYSGPEYVMFSDTLTFYPVQNSTEWFNVPVASTVACDYDRTFGIEIDDKASNAIENKHYEIESSTITIKAGERAANLRIRGLYDNIGETDSLAVTLRLLSKENVQWSMYGAKTRVQMIKACPFDFNVFTGYCLVQSTFFKDYMVGTEKRLIKTEKDPSNENTIILKDFYYKGYNLKLEFDPSNPLKPFVEMDKQVLGTTAEAFGTTYGNGKLMIDRPTEVESYYNVCQSFVVLYTTISVDNVGTVGTYVNVLEWISDEEADQIIKDGI